MKTLRCPHCGQMHPATAGFCPKTGKALEARGVAQPPLNRKSPRRRGGCPHCGQKHASTAKFCPVTGGALVPQGAGESPGTTLLYGAVVLAIVLGAIVLAPRLLHAGNSEVPTSGNTLAPPAATESPAAPTPATEVPAASLVPERTFSVEVEAISAAGVPAGLAVHRGDVIKFDAPGTWCFGVPLNCTNADGDPGRPAPEECCAALQGGHFGELIGRVGNWLFPIGSHATVTVLQDGELLLLMNDRDGSYGDNGGSLTVQIGVPAASGVPVAPAQSPVVPPPITASNATCSAYVDIGDEQSESGHDLGGWGGAYLNQPASPSGDTSFRYQSKGSPARITLCVPQIGVSYTLTTEVQDFGCEDSFEIFVNNDASPIYQFTGTRSNVIRVHNVQIPARQISSTDLNLGFQATSSDCGYAAVYDVRIAPGP